MDGGTDGRRGVRERDSETKVWMREGDNASAGENEYLFHIQFILILEIN